MIYATVSAFLFLGVLVLFNPIGKSPGQAAKSKPSSGLSLEHFDKKTSPAKDFYRYVNGTWLDESQIPDDKSSYGVFSSLADHAQEQIKTIISDIDSDSSLEEGSESKKIKDLYKSFMDTEKIERLGLDPLRDQLAQIQAVNSHSDLAERFASASQNGYRSPLGVYASIDYKDPNRYVAFVYQSGLGLADRDQYLKADERNIQLQLDYKKHVARMFEFLGSEVATAAATAEKIYELEKRLATVQMSRTESRQREKTYNPYAPERLGELASHFDWDGYFSSIQAKGMDKIIVSSPDYIRALDEIISKTPIETWKLYFTWHCLHANAEYLSSKIAAEHFDFYGRILNGIESQELRWKQGVDLVESALGEPLGKIYVTKHFKPEAKERMVVLVENLREAYAQSIDNLTWMSDETKAKARVKLSKFRPKIGYPDKWRDFSDLKIDENDLLGNVSRSAQFEFKENIAKLGQEIDRDEWHMTPQTVNAYYNPNQNEIVFPAAILQPPFFNLDADDAVNYGGIGAVIGHEMGHGFDDQGAKFDGDGKMENWWTQSDLDEFKARTHQLVEQFSKFEPIPGHKLNGEFTLGENIGDLGGLTIAHKAYLASLGGQASEVLDGFTGEQRFFLGWAQVWPRLYREESLLNRLLTDPHSPSEFRVNGIVPNLPGFYAAFEVSETDPLYLPPEKRVKIW